GSWTAQTIGGLPTLLVRDKVGQLRAFLNVCRHRASPLCEDGEAHAGSLIRCPYHSWIYQLDGSLSRAAGVGDPEGFDVADYPLQAVQITQWRRMIFVNFDPQAAPLDLGPLGRAVDAYPLESMELALSETNDRQFNWKVLLENYSENYHTPFVHPEIDTSSSEDYPMVSDGITLYAWDRPRRPSETRVDEIRSTLLPGEPGWDELASTPMDGPYSIGGYLTVWPNLMMNVFPGAFLAMWMQPIDATSTRVERRLFVRPDVGAETRRSIIEAHELVHRQDVDICNRVQGSHNAGLDADGVLATVEERGVYFIHEHLRNRLEV
ncbi:MAG TPA: aromatic ring-hydroxylating dioxygenase subunit alpha, partial [Ilumatobacteraceae bacterium]|nr:aromatic ring-hydroxylating dioxygenase subunit alpha [Ilumatobacteraceae bacterium]